MATGHNRPMIGYVDPASRKAGEGPVRWLDVAKIAKVTTGVDPATQGVNVEARFAIPTAAAGCFASRSSRSSPGAIAVSADCTVDAPREVVFLPLLLLLPGHGSFGSLKGQGLFAGVEYLDNEPSSSTADLNEKAGANRRVPDSARITFPLMAVQAHDHYVGLIWDRAPELAALFDSPDRIFGSESHVLGLIAPGADGVERENGALFPIEPQTLEPGQPVKASALIIGGKRIERDPRRPAVRRPQGPACSARRRPTWRTMFALPRRAGSTRRSARAAGFATPWEAPSAPSRRPTPPG